MMRTLIWFFRFFGSLLLLTPKCNRLNKMKQQGDPKADELIGQAIAQWADMRMVAAGVTVEVTGQENIPKEPVVFVANHQGYFDIPVLLTRLDKPHPLISKKEIGQIPMIKKWMEMLDCVFIDRDNARQSVAGLNTAAQALREHGKSFIIFPEGTRSKGGPTHEFKNGGFKVAFKAGCPIVPICIDGTYRAMEANNYRIQPAHVKMTILPAIETKGMSREETKQIGERVRKEIEALLPEPLKIQN